MRNMIPVPSKLVPFRVRPKWYLMLSRKAWANARASEAILNDPKLQSSFREVLRKKFVSNILFGTPETSQSHSELVAEVLDEYERSLR